MKTNGEVLELNSKKLGFDHARPENVGKFTIANISYFSESGIWLGKILANDIRFANFVKVFPRQSFALYSISFFHFMHVNRVCLQKRFKPWLDTLENVGSRTNDACA